MISGNNLYDDYDPDDFDETGEELAYRLPGAHGSPNIDLEDPTAR